MNMVRIIRAKTPELNSVKIPLKSITVANDSVEFLQQMKELEEYFYNEINSLTLNLSDLSGIVKYNIVPNHRVIGLKYKKDAKKIKAYIQTLAQDEITALLSQNSIYTAIENNNFEITPNDVVVSPEIIYKTQPREKVLIDNKTVVVVDFTQDQSVVDEHTSRMLNYYIQSMRKTACLTSVDRVIVNYYTESNYVHTLIEKARDLFESRIKAKIQKIPALNEFEQNENNNIIIKEKFDMDDNTIHIFLTTSIPTSVPINVHS